MKAQIELQTGQKFEYYQPLVYRRSPYMDKGGIGPVLTELDYVIKVRNRLQLIILTNQLFFFRCQLKNTLSVFISQSIKIQLTNPSI